MVSAPALPLLLFRLCSSQLILSLAYWHAGNTCFINAALQLIVRTPGLPELLVPGLLEAPAQPTPVPTAPSGARDIPAAHPADRQAAVPPANCPAAAAPAAAATVGPAAPLPSPPMPTITEIAPLTPELPLAAAALPPPCVAPTASAHSCPQLDLRKDILCSAGQHSHVVDGHDAPACSSTAAGEQPQSNVAARGDGAEQITKRVASWGPPTPLSIDCAACPPSLQGSPPSVWGGPQHAPAEAGGLAAAVTHTLLHGAASEGACCQPSNNPSSLCGICRMCLSAHLVTGQQAADEAAVPDTPGTLQEVQVTACDGGAADAVKPGGADATESISMRGVSDQQPPGKRAELPGARAEPLPKHPPLQPGELVACFCQLVRQVGLLLLRLLNNRTWLLARGLHALPSGAF